MKKIIWKMTLMVLLSSSLTACYFDFDDDGGRPDFSRCEEGFGGTVTEDLYLDEFTGIDLNVDAQVYISEGEEAEVYVKGQENIIDELEWDVRNGVWEIEFDDCVEDSDILRIYITSPDITYLSNNSSGNIRIENILQAEELEIRNNGSGDIDLSVEAGLLHVRNSGSGTITLEGTTNAIDLLVRGSGDVEGFGLLCKDAQVEVDGSGDSRLYVEDFMEVVINGSGNVYYRGDPDIRVTTRGSGKVFHAD